MNWTCDQIEARLSDFLEGLLTQPETKEFEAHVKGCAECGPLVASVRTLVGEMHSMEAVQVPSGLVYSILDQTLGPQEKKAGWQGLWNFARGLATPKFAYGTASVMATCILVLNIAGFSLRKPKLADLRPATIYRNVNRQAHLVYAHGEKYVSDLRVVYEIQSRLRQENELPVTPEKRTPSTSPEQRPGKSDDHTRTQPKQQNRANELAQQVELLAAGCPLMFERSNR